MAAGRPWSAPPCSTRTRRRSWSRRSAKAPPSKPLPGSTRSTRRRSAAPWTPPEPANCPSSSQDGVAHRGLYGRSCLSGVHGSAWHRRANPSCPCGPYVSCVGSAPSMRQVSCCGWLRRHRRDGLIPVVGRCGSVSCSWRSSPACSRPLPSGCPAAGRFAPTSPAAMPHRAGQSPHAMPDWPRGAHPAAQSGSDGQAGRGEAAVYEVAAVLDVP